jgi:hypothetical protein
MRQIDVPITSIVIVLYVIADGTSAEIAVGVTDDPELLQLARGFGDTFTAYAEHSRNEFLGHGQLVGGQAIERQFLIATRSNGHCQIRLNPVSLIDPLRPLAVGHERR